MNNKKKIFMFCVMLCLFTIIFDQATKFAVLAFIPAGTVIRVCSSVNLILTLNHGTSFGLLTPNTAFQFYLIMGITVGCIIFLGYIFLRLRAVTERLLCAILIGGALGNFIDRLLHGAVVDFVDIYYKNWHWPAFNFADTCITCSVIGLILHNLISKDVS